MENTNYSARFGNMNLLTDEEKSSYRAFAQKVHNMSHKDVFLLNSDMRDKLTTEQQDIVAWELKIRELDIYKKKNIKPEEVFDVYNVTGNVGYDENNPNLQIEKMAEKKAMIGMDDKLLEESKRILENNPVVISSNNLHNIHGGGVNIMANKYIVEDDKGIADGIAGFGEHFDALDMVVHNHPDNAKLRRLGEGESGNVDFRLSQRAADAGELSRSVLKEDADLFDCHVS